MKILLVDDDAFLRDMYALKFEQAGDTITAVANGLEALAKLEEETFDVLITDMVMPNMTGLDLIKSVRDSGAHGETKFLVLSNQSEPADKEAAEALGVAGYIVKAEMLPSEVVDTVHSIITPAK